MADIKKRKERIYQIAYITKYKKKGFSDTINKPFINENEAEKWIKSYAKSKGHKITFLSIKFLGWN